MTRGNAKAKTTLRVNKQTEGQSIEQRVRRMMKQKEPITDGAPLVFQERKDGVDPVCDIRTDRFQLALEAQGQAVKNHLAGREPVIKLDTEGGEIAPTDVQS